MKCRVTAGGASYEFTEKSLASARVKSCRRPLEIRLPPSSFGVEMAGHWGFLWKTSNYCAAFFFCFACSVCILSTKCASVTGCTATFVFYISAANIIGCPSTANCQTNCTSTDADVLVVLLSKRCTAERNCFSLSPTAVHQYTFIVSCRANATQV